MDQKSEAWHAWRDKGIGSSDAPVIMGLSPWRTPFELWEEKTGRKKREEGSNYAQSLGNTIEPIVRARYEAINDFEMGPANCQHENFPWLKASMDCWNPMMKRGAEIKFLGAEDFRVLKEERKMPAKYVPQVQHQFLVTGAEQIDFIGYWLPKGAEPHTGKMDILPVKPDIEYMRKLFMKEQEFFHYMINGIAPGLVKEDFKLIRVSGAKAMADKYTELMRLDVWSKEETVMLRTIEERLLDMAGEELRSRVGLVRIEDKTFTIIEE